MAKIEKMEKRKVCAIKETFGPSKGAFPCACGVSDR